MKFLQPTTGFREGAELPEYKHFTQIDCSELGSPFVCYIFELNEGADAESFMTAARENADGFGTVYFGYGQMGVLRLLRR